MYQNTKGLEIKFETSSVVFACAQQFFQAEKSNHFFTDIVELWSLKQTHLNVPFFNML
jgi:hypothetical protein